MTALRRVHDLLPHLLENFPREVLVAGKRKGKWIKYSPKEFSQLVDQTSRGLIASGIQKGDKVAIMSANRPEWNICDFAIMQIGATQVPMYPTLSGNDIRFILTDANIKTVFVGTEELAQKLQDIKEKEKLELAIFCFKPGCFPFRYRVKYLPRSGKPRRFGNFNLHFRHNRNTQRSDVNSPQFGK
jgi:long-chain acyl-CoA synthetase